MNLDTLLAIADEYLSKRVVSYPMTQAERECSAALDAVVKARSIVTSSAPQAATTASADKGEKA